MSRVIYGTRVSLEVGIIGTAISTMIGVIVGMLAGFYRGWVDTLLSRTMDVFLSIPILLLGLGIGAACAVRGCAAGLIQPGLGVIIFLIAHRDLAVHRAHRARPRAVAARARVRRGLASRSGASDLRIMFREILPNLAAPIIVYASLQIPVNILIEAALSYLGVGIRPPTAELGPDDRRRRRRSSTPHGGTWSFPAPRCC